MKAFLPLWMSLAALNSHHHYAVAEEALNYQPEILESKDGLLEVTFQVGMVTSLNGDRIGQGYNGKPVGPTLRLKAGDTLRLSLENNLEPNTDVDVELFEYIMTSDNDANVSTVSHRLFVYFFMYGLFLCCILLVWFTNEKTAVV
jgi:FtsP/CotA-like multicopper oxidase with cupredoxin domain